MRRYFWDLDQEDKNELFERALHGSGETSLGVAIFGKGGDSSKLLSKHMEGERERISVDLASDLIDAAVPDFEFEDPDSYVIDSYSRGGNQYLDIEDDFRDYLFRPYSNQRLAELTGKSPSSCKEYRFRSERSVPREIYEDVFQNTREILLDSQEASASIEKPAVERSGTVIEEAGENEALLFKRLEELNQGKYDTEPFRSVLENAQEVLSDSFRETFRPENQWEGRYCSLLDQAGVLEPWGAKRYRVADQSYPEILLKELE
ncbi:hypothetical protein [Candidatus Nanohalococcus occultus]|uniref:Uncharacterized protein n=1 Tax=Candidatus Nanohalococcus occultus TaxID=2978047 RepID=A0ABY8CEX0_9ARCH|nr:hypothetical protein SVXNc_0723 [Candidatus Nanohaloarchaeota archaeon SVXNc]